MGDTSHGTWGSAGLGDFLGREDGAHRHARRVAARATELLECMRRSETGVVLLPTEPAWGEWSKAAGEHGLSLQAMGLLEHRGLATRAARDPQFPHWPAYQLAEIVGGDP